MKSEGRAICLSSRWSIWGVTLKHRIGGKPMEIEEVLSLSIEDRRCAGRRARGGHRASRHQAREHLHHQTRARQGSGFRAGESNGLIAKSIREFGLRIQCCSTSTAQSLQGTGGLRELSCLAFPKFQRFDWKG